MKEKDAFAVRVRVLRREKNLTQAQLGEVLGVRERTIRAYEGETLHPDYKGLLEMARFFGVSLDFLVGWSEKREIS